MTTLQIISETPVCNEAKKSYTSIAFDDRYFYFTVSKSNEIQCFNKNFIYLTSSYSNDIYSSICYDMRMNCFWAIKQDKALKVYKLDKNFIEIAQISIIYKNPSVRMTGISSYRNDKLLISCTDGIGHIDIAEYSELTITIPKSDDTSFYSSSVTELYSGILYSDNENNASFVNFILPSGKPILECCLPKAYSVTDMTVSSPTQNNKKQVIYILAYKQHCYSYVLKCLLHSSHEPDPPCPPDPPIPPDPPPCPPSCCGEGKEDIMKSIACIQTSICSLISADSKKIEKIVATSDDPQEMMQANESVNKLIINVTHLEQMLFNILEIVLNKC